MEKETLNIILFYGGDSATEPRDQLLNWLRTPPVSEILGKRIEARKASDYPADSGHSVHERVNEAIDWADKALILITPDPRGLHGAPNVLEEFGRWQGKKSGQTMAVIRHEDVPSHSNATGLIYIGYRDDVLQECSEKLLAFLAQEDIPKQIDGRAGSKNKTESDSGISNNIPAKTISPNKIIHECLSNAFEDESIKVLCQNHFDHVARRLHPTDGLDQIIIKVIQYCNQRMEMEYLWACIKEERPRSYDKYFLQWQNVASD